MQKSFITRTACNSFICSLGLLCTASCGWHAVDPNTVATLSVPYVEGDSDGSLTTFLVEEIEKSGSFRFSSARGDYKLKVRLCDSKYENIGFQFDPEKSEKDKIIPNETRSKILAEVTLIDASTNQVVLGPIHILASHEYDHQNYSMNNNINSFSMGQLSDIDTSKGVVHTPLYRNLAKEIGKYLANHPLQRNHTQTAT